MTKVVMVIAPHEFRDEELFETKEVLESKNIKVDIASVGVKEAKGKLGGKAKVNLEVSAIHPNEYDGIVFVGGAGAKIYFEDFTVQELAIEFYTKGKVVAAICIAPSILANADLLVGIKATSFESERENLVDKGAEYTGEDVTVDGSIITANGPDAAEEFGEKIAESLM